RHTRSYGDWSSDVCSSDLSERENVGRDYNERTRTVRLFYKLGVIVNSAVGRGILNERAEDCVVEFKTRVVVVLDFNSEWFCACRSEERRVGKEWREWCGGS